VCGDVCPPKEYCQVCCEEAKKNAEIEVFELKKYRNLDLNKFPIVVLGCGHFFSAKNLDKHMGMSDAYLINNETGEYVGFKSFRQFASTYPSCPLCNEPVRQHLINRYNRIINWARHEQGSRQFLSKGLSALQDADSKISVLEQNLNRSREVVFSRLAAYQNQDLSVPLKNEVEKLLKMCSKSSDRLVATITKSSNDVSKSSQFSMIMNDAITACGRTFHGRKLPTDREEYVISAVTNARVTLGFRAAGFKVEYVILAHALNVSRGLGAIGSLTPIQVPGSSLDGRCVSFFEVGRNFINDCEAAKLPKIAVEAQIYFAKIARAFEVYCYASDIDLTVASNILVEAEEFLNMASFLITNVPFKNANLFAVIVEQTQKLLKQPWFEEVTAEEVASIQQSGPSTDAYSGNWFMCKMGHPVSLFPFSGLYLRTDSSSHSQRLDPTTSLPNVLNVVSNSRA